MKTAINQHIIGLKPSATLVINEQSNALIQQGKEVIKLGFGQSPFPVPNIVVEALKTHAHEKDYLPVKGLSALREAVAAYHNRQLGLDFSGEDILIGPGSKELLFITQLIYEGSLLLPRPSWVSYAPQAQISQKQHYWLDTFAKDGYLLDPHILASFCKQHPDGEKLLILNYPSNPTGSSFERVQLKTLAEVAKKYNILVLSDEIYGDTHHAGQHLSIANFYPEGTIISAGLSKWCGAGGWRLGTFAFPKELRWLLDQSAIVASETFTTTSAPIQYAAVKAYEGGKEIQEYLKHTQMVLKMVAQESWKILQEANISSPQPKGGFYLMPDFTHYQEALAKQGIYTSEQLCRALLEQTGVALLPLSDFGMPDSFLGARLSYVDFDGSQALKKIKKDPGIKAEALAPKVITGIRRLGEWFKKI